MYVCEVHPIIHSSTHSFIHSFINPISIDQSLTHSLTHSLTYLLTQSNSINQSTNRSIGSLSVGIFIYLHQPLCLLVLFTNSFFSFFHTPRYRLIYHFKHKVLLEIAILRCCFACAEEVNPKEEVEEMEE